MNNTLIFTITGVSSLFLGILSGYIMFRIKTKRNEKKLIKEAEKFLSGEKENSIEIDGKKYGAYCFKLKDDNGKEIIINVKGGDNGEEKNSEEGIEFIEDNPTIRKVSDSNGKKQQDTRKKKRTNRGTRRRFY